MVRGHSPSQSEGVALTAAPSLGGDDSLKLGTGPELCLANLYQGPMFE